MEFINVFMKSYGLEIIAAILTAIAGVLGVVFKRLAARYIDTDTKQAVAKSAVAFVEQVWRDIHGKDKLNKALTVAEALLKKKGLDFDAEEMEILIEAALAEFNDAFAKPLIQENTADAVRRVEQVVTE